jgi:RNA polymerase sigma-70 factor (ECF subfamily)
MNEPFRKLVGQYKDKVFTFVYYSLKNREEAEDVTQEVLMKLWQHKDTVNPDNLTAWVMRVARNAVIDVSRRRRTRSAVFADGADFELAETVVAAPGADTEVGLRSREMKEALESALAAVEEPYRSIIVLREIQDMTYAEIVEVLEMPLNTVKVYLHRGRRMLREALRGKV